MPAEPQPTKAREPEHCYICGRRVGVFQWTDASGLAHPWCATGEDWGWRPDLHKPTEADVGHQLKAATNAR